MRFYPGGDIYFGALINSWIHVMMYSYYTLSLLKIPCPWKKYLTQAQLLQFVSVVVYSLLSLAQMQREAHWTHYYAYSTQLFEMVSLFVLFMHFYRKAYSKKTKAKTLTSTTEETASSIIRESDMTPEQSSEQEQSSVSSHGSDEN